MKTTTFKIEGMNCHHAVNCRRGPVSLSHFSACPRTHGDSDGSFNRNRLPIRALDRGSVDAAQSQKDSRPDRRPAPLALHRHHRESTRPNARRRQSGRGRCGASLVCAARIRASFTIALRLDRWTRQGTIRTKYATVPGLRLKPHATPLAVVEKLAGLGGHCFRRTMAAVRASDRGLDLHRFTVQVLREWARQRAPKPARARETPSRDQGARQCSLRGSQQHKCCQFCRPLNALGKTSPML